MKYITYILIYILWLPPCFFSPRRVLPPSPACCTRRRESPVTKSSDARAIFAQSCGYPSSRVPQWLLEPLHRHTRHTVASVPVTCLRHSSNGRPRTGTRKFTQEQGLERCPPAHKMGDLSRLARTPARLRIRSAHATEVFCQPRSAHIARTPISLFNCHGRR